MKAVDPDPGEHTGNLLPAAQRRGVPVLARVLLVLLGILAFASALDGPFVFDDVNTIVESEHVRSIFPLSRSMSGVVSSPAAGRPLVAFSLALNYAIGELAPWTYRVVNLALHVAAALVLFGIVRRTLRRGALAARFASAADGLSFTIAALWLVHPIQTEPINYVSQRTELMMGLFYLLTLYASIRVERSSRPRAWYALAVVACASGMASKEVMVSAPVMVVLYDFCFRVEPFRTVLRRRWPLYLGLASTWALLAILVAQDGRGASAGLASGVDVLSYAKNQCVILVDYLAVVVWPHTLTFDYGFPVPVTAGEAAPGAMLAVAVLIASVTLLARGSPGGFLGLWFLVILAPTTSVVPIATEVGAERRLYLPLAAPIALVVLGTYSLCTRFLPERGRRVVRALAAFAVVVAMVVRTEIRNWDYSSGVAIWRSAVAARPANWRAHNNLGRAFGASGDEGRAAKHFEIALALKPDYVPAILNVALSLEKRGSDEGAIRMFRRVAELDPEYPPAYFRIGRLLVKQGELDEAIAQYRRALALSPEFVAARKELASTLLRQGRVDDSVREYEELVRSAPDSPTARRDLERARAVAAFRARPGKRP